MPSYPGFLGPSSRNTSYMADNEICQNWFLEPTQSQSAPVPWVMKPTPGFRRFFTAVTGPIRGMFYQQTMPFSGLSACYFVAGGGFYVGFGDRSLGQLGVVENDGLPVTINSNGDAGNQLWITSGGKGYIYDQNAGTLTEQGVPGTTVTMGAFLSARFLYLDATSGAFYASGLYDGTVWDPLMVAQSASGSPWLALVVTPDNLIRLLGESSSECWADQGTFPFPFSQIKEAGGPYGIAATWAWSLDTTLNWLSQNQQGRGLIVRANGYDAAPISTLAITTEIQRYDTVSDTIAFTYQQDGHAFAVFTFPTAQTTKVYDLTTNLWHTRDYWDTTTATSFAYRPGCTISAFGQVLAGDRLTGTIYVLDPAVYTDVDGAVIRRVRQPPRFSVNQKRITVTDLQLVMDVGNGLSGGGGTEGGDAWGGAWGDAWGTSWETLAVDSMAVATDPQMMLEVSRDGGKTFPLKRWCSAGKMGEWNNRVYWTNLGQARNFTPRFVATDPVPWPVVDLLIEYREGTS